ncbi:hypothetical protein RhiirA4_427006 [Rhizophagus irregularis]|uniref:Uncharacterized protein n=1 Tax=Rhizophagus irregularis TaxID=588596 RepID=A0A2I1H7B7_9GLOM|nr:hypothetical protein RhiirA4_427006 [Rhizophagus irregularis]
MRDLFRKNFNSTAFKKWEKAGKPTEEDEEILVELLEYSSIRKAKITRMVLTPPLTLDQLVRNQRKMMINEQLEGYSNNNGTSKRESPSPPQRTQRQQITTTSKNDKCSEDAQRSKKVESPKLYQEKFGGQYQRILWE